MTPSRTVTLLVAGLGACATPTESSPRDAGLELPATWSGAPDAPTGEPPDAWWSGFGDARLDALVDEALEHNRDLHAAAARVEAAVARARIAGSDLWPQLALNGSGDRSRSVFVNFPFGTTGSGPPDITATTYRASLDLTWELDLWGRIRAGKLAAESDVEATGADLRAARLSIAARTASGWFACVEANEQLELARASAQSFRRTADQVRQRFDAGVRPALDLRLALADADAADALVERRRRERDAALRELQILVGRYPDAALEPGADLPAIDAPVPAGLPSELLERRPDLVAAERRLAAADARVGEARANLYPRLSLTASGGATSADLQDLTDLDFRIWSLGANILAPLFEGGRLRANVDLQDALRKEAIARFAASVLQALREVESALAAGQMLATEVQRRTAQVEQASAARALSEDRYSRGLDDIITLSTAQRRELDARTTAPPGAPASPAEPHRPSPRTRRRLRRRARRRRLGQDTMTDLRNILRVLLPLLVLALGAGGAMALYQSREEIRSSATAPSAPTVETMTVSVADVQLSVHAQGTVQPATESELAAEVGGRVQSVAPGLEEGAFFAAGDLLVRIDSRDYELAVVEARSAVARAELQLSLEEAEAESARREWQSLQRPGDPPPLVVREPQLAQAEAELAAARARLESAERDVERTVIRAPYDGRCLEKSVDLGQFVQRGTRLARVYATDAAEVRLPLPSEELEFLDLDIQRQNGEFLEASGPTVTLRGRFAGREHEWTGRIVRTEGRLDERSRMVHMIARVEKPYAADTPLLVGMFVDAEIQGRHIERCISLPRRALVGASSVHVVDADGHLWSRDVDVLRATEHEVLVRDGLQPGERVCVTRLEVTSDGMKVRVADDATATSGDAPEGGR